jgi:hypothetical protein
VHTFTRFGVPFTIARTRCTFGFQRRFVRRCEWLSFIPKTGFLPHTSQTDDIGTHLASNRATELGTRAGGAVEKNRVRLAPAPIGTSDAVPVRN